ncbi:MAG: hypothetical protein ACRDA5_04075, partial [Clostridium sp.]
KEITLVINKIGELYENRTIEEGQAKVNRVIESVKNTLRENNLNNINLFALDSRDYLWAIDDELYKISHKENNSKISKMLTQEEYLERSSFDKFRQYLLEYLNKDNREAKFYEDIKERILVLLDAFKEELTTNEKIDYKNKILKNLENQKILIIENRRMIINTTKRQLRSSTEEFGLSLKEDIKNESKEIKKKILLSIKSNIIVQKDLDYKHRELISQYVKKIVIESSLQYLDKLKKYQLNINQVLSNTFNKEFANVFIERKDIKFDINPSKVNFHFTYMENKADKNEDIVKTLERDIKTRETELKAKKNTFENHPKDFNKRILKCKGEIRVYESNFESEKLKLGKKPEPTQEYVMETRTKKTWIFFKKEYQVKVLKDPDYSKVNEWERKKEEITIVYNRYKREKLQEIDSLKVKELEHDNLGNKIVEEEDKIKQLKLGLDNTIRKREQLIQDKKKMFFENKKEELYIEFTNSTDKHLYIIADKLDEIIEKFYKVTLDMVTKQAEIHFEKFENIINHKLDEYKKNSNSIRKNHDELIKEIISVEQIINNN